MNTKLGFTIRFATILAIFLCGLGVHPTLAAAPLLNGEAAPPPALVGQNATKPPLPTGFCYVTDIIPDIWIELRYYGEHNFVGSRVDGYESPVAILSTPAALALKKAQEKAKAHGYSLKIFDAYRPQKAVSHFVRWGKDANDTNTKAEFYPREKKEELFQRGYISSRSRHSSGSTVDLTLVRKTNGAELDMGSHFDFLDPISHHESQQITKAQAVNRKLLKTIMTESGFVPYQREWWHYTLANEPFKGQFFDFSVR